VIRGIHHVAISTPDVDRLAGFYRDVVGFDEVVLDFAWGEENVAGPLVMRTGGPSVGRCVMLRAGNAFLELFEFEQPEPRPGDPARPVVDHGITHLCVDVDDVDAEYERLSAAGVEFHCEPQPMGMGIRTTYARDPDGNVFEVQQIPSAWHRCALPPWSQRPERP
jgi:catechol 2,3-dioxygenase-like lactoylglutathione lyase family enzyme